MPQIQVLPGVPSFGSQLAQVLTQAGSQIGEGLLKHQQKTRLNELLSSMPEQPTAKDILGLASQLTPEQQQAYLPLFTQMMNPTETSYQKAIGKETAKKQFEKEAVSEKLAGKERLLGELEQDIGYTGTTKIPFTKSAGAFRLTPEELKEAGFIDKVRHGASLLINPKGVEKRAEFDAKAQSLMAIYRELETRGQMPKAIFEKLQENIPNTKHSERENLGKIRATRSILKAQFGENILKEISEATGVKPTKQGAFKELDATMAQKFLKAAGGDKDKARKLARKNGYDF
jgi:hypothetical protein